MSSLQMLVMLLLTQHTSWLSSLEKHAADLWSTSLPGPHILCCRVNAPKLVGPQPVLRHGAAPTQTQHTVLVSVELHEVPVVPSIQLVNRETSRSLQLPLSEPQWFLLPSVFS